MKKLARRGEALDAQQTDPKKKRDDDPAPIQEGGGGGEDGRKRGDQNQPRGGECTLGGKSSLTKYQSNKVVFERGGRSRRKSLLHFGSTSSGLHRKRAEHSH